MATRKPKARVEVFPSSFVKGRSVVYYGNHIVGVLQESKEHVRILRLKVDRREDGSGVYVIPVDDEAKPFDSTIAAADAVLAYWLTKAPMIAKDLAA